MACSEHTQVNFHCATAPAKYVSVGGYACSVVHGHIENIRSAHSQTVWADELNIRSLSNCDKEQPTATKTHQKIYQGSVGMACQRHNVKDQIKANVANNPAYSSVSCKGEAGQIANALQHKR
jgi:hypothetical protein